VSSESSLAVRQARHTSQNAWAQHVERVESKRDEPSGIWARERSIAFLDQVMGHIIITVMMMIIIIIQRFNSVLIRDNFVSADEEPDLKPF